MALGVMNDFLLKYLPKCVTEKDKTEENTSNKHQLRETEDCVNIFVANSSHNSAAVYFNVLLLLYTL